MHLCACKSVKQRVFMSGITSRDQAAALHCLSCSQHTNQCLPRIHTSPQNDTQISSVLGVFFGVAFNPHIGLRCAPSAADPTRLELQEVRLCLSKKDFTRYNCRWGYHSS
jgi:hypothetical protein